MINASNYHVSQSPLERAVGLYGLTIKHPKPDNEIVDYYQVFNDDGDVIAYFGYSHTGQEWCVRFDPWGALGYYEGGPDDWRKIALTCIEWHYPQDPKEDAS